MAEVKVHKSSKIKLEEEKKEIIRRYRKLLRKAKPLLKEGDAKLIKKAFNISAEAHKDMRRDSGEPYIFHPLSVAQICVEEIGLGTTSIICALLHDVVEDTHLDLDDIKEAFNDRVANIIDGLTKISGVFEYGSSQQAENFRKMLLTLSEDVRVILIKLADRLHNMRTLNSIPREKQLKIASETIYLYAPLAHRLGLYTIKSELEDLYLKYTEFDIYNEIAKKIDITKNSRDKFIKGFVKPLQVELKKHSIKFEIKARLKSIHSIWKKMKTQNVPLEEVYDLFAVRIILFTKVEKEKAECWQAYSIITDHYKPNPDRLRDWISTPKANGYESLHTTVMGKNGQWIEIQIRTQRMDEIAEKGYAAHWKYKHNIIKRESSLEEWIDKVRDLLEQNEGSAIEFVDDFKSNLFTEEIFVFTPRGELKILPHGATALDFAFEIHTEIGASCIGAKVNQKLVPLNYILKNGDQIEILTSTKQKPKEDWLRFVVSSKAKTKIKDTLKEFKKAGARDGREIVNRKLKRLKIDPSSEVYDKLRVHFSQSTQIDFFYKVGKGLISPGEIKNVKDLGKPQKLILNRSKEIKDLDSFKKEIQKAKGKKQDLLLIGEDMDYVDYRFAKCCSPIPGDNVFGYVTVNEGIKIHRTSCSNAPELLSKHGQRIVKAKWASKHESSFLVSLEIIGTDRVGLIKDVTEIISNELKVNMRSITVDTDTGIFEGNIKLYVNDKRHLDLLIEKLTKVNGVIKVSRYENPEDQEKIRDH